MLGQSATIAATSPSASPPGLAASNPSLEAGAGASDTSSLPDFATALAAVTTGDKGGAPEGPAAVELVAGGPSAGVDASPTSTPGSVAPGGVSPEPSIDKPSGAPRPEMGSQPSAPEPQSSLQSGPLGPPRPSLVAEAVPQIKTRASVRPLLAGIGGKPPTVAKLVAVATSSPLLAPAPTSTDPTGVKPPDPAAASQPQSSASMSDQAVPKGASSSPDLNLTATVFAPGGLISPAGPPPAPGGSWSLLSPARGAPSGLGLAPSASQVQGAAAWLQPAAPSSAAAEFGSTTSGPAAASGAVAAPTALSPPSPADAAGAATPTGSGPLALVAALGPASDASGAPFSASGSIIGTVISGSSQNTAPVSDPPPSPVAGAGLAAQATSGSPLATGQVAAVSAAAVATTALASAATAPAATASAATARGPTLSPGDAPIAAAPALSESANAAPQSALTGLPTRRLGATTAEPRTSPERPGGSTLAAQSDVRPGAALVVSTQAVAAPGVIGLSTPTGSTQGLPANIASEAQSTSQTVGDLAMQTATKVAGGASQFQIELHPQDLGRVNVSVQIDAAGQIHASFAFEKLHAAEDLSARSSELRSALEQAGFGVAQSGLSFAMAHVASPQIPQPTSAPATVGSSAFQDLGQSPGQSFGQGFGQGAGHQASAGFGQPNGRGRAFAAAAEAAAAADQPRLSAYETRVERGLDIRI